MEEYDQARSVLLQAAQFRQAVEHPETVDFILTSLESTWLLTERFKEGMAFFSDYIAAIQEILLLTVDVPQFSGIRANFSKRLKVIRAL